MDNTIIIFLADNGACAEFYDELGSQPFSYINDLRYSAVSYGIGWANASNTPFFEYKVKPYEGGIATPMIVHSPFSGNIRGTAPCGRAISKWSRSWKMPTGNFSTSKTTAPNATTSPPSAPNSCRKWTKNGRIGRIPTKFSPRNCSKTACLFQL